MLLFGQRLALGPRDPSHEQLFIRPYSAVRPELHVLYARYPRQHSGFEGIEELQRLGYYLEQSAMRSFRTSVIFLAGST